MRCVIKELKQALLHCQFGTWFNITIVQRDVKGACAMKNLSCKNCQKLNSKRMTDSLYECRCDCGNTVFVWGEDLKSGKVQSCGLCSSDKNGQELNARDNRKRLYICKCGNTIIFSAND